MFRFSTTYDVANDQSPGRRRVGAGVASGPTSDFVQTEFREWDVRGKLNTDKDTDSPMDVTLYVYPHGTARYFW